MSSYPTLAEPAGLSHRWRRRSDAPSRSRAGGSGARVLVAFASRHGATREIAAALARWLPDSEAAGGTALSVVLAPVQRALDPADFDAVVLGSGLYAGRWLEPARHYADAFTRQLGSRPTWLFSSGLAGEPPGLPHQVDDARDIAGSIGAHGHQVFSGRLERRLLSAAEHDAWTTGSAAWGDFRDWEAVRAWSEEIAATVVARRAAAVWG